MTRLIYSILGYFKDFIKLYNGTDLEIEELYNSLSLFIAKSTKLIERITTFYSQIENIEKSSRHNPSIQICKFSKDSVNFFNESSKLKLL